MVYEVAKSKNYSTVTVFLNRATIEDAVGFKQFLTNVIENGEKNIIVDLSHTQFIDSTFLGVLVASLKILTKNEGQLRLVVSKDAPSSIFVLTRMDKVFPIFKSFREAKKGFTAAVAK
ncbi:MAG: STAS domain-containing protein [Ignavibacteria bacterium]|nr:STAS domain-containing protein [Ignavibacteria bacterium]